MRIDSLRKVIAERNMTAHPFYQRWKAGELELEELQAFAGQVYHLISAFPRYLSAVHSQCPHPEVRKALLENLVEEERGAENYPELWLRFCEGMALPREKVLAAPVLPPTAALLDTFYTLTWRTWTEGLAAIYAYEWQVPEVAESSVEALTRGYGVRTARTLQCFHTQLEADLRHRAVIERIFIDAVPEVSAEAVLATAKTAAQALLAFLNGMLPEELAMLGALG